MSKILTTKSNAIFLAIILLVGTFAVLSPSLMIGTAQAQPYYGEMDRDRDSDRKQVSVSSLKCNNINVNVNGLELSVLPPFLTSLAASESDDEERGASTYGSGSVSYDGGQSRSDGDFKFVCINNNNNTVVVEEPLPPVEEECPEADEIESCFRQFLLDALFPNFVEALESETGITVEINGQEVTLRSFDDICEALEGLTTFGQLQIAVGNILQEALGFVPMNPEFFSCIAEALGIPVLHG